MNKKLQNGLVAAVSAAMGAGIVAPVIAAAATTGTSLDAQYKGAYDATVLAQTSKTQKDMTTARGLVDGLYQVVKGTSNEKLATTLSQILDGLQQPLLVKTVDAIAKAGASTAKQADVNVARALIVDMPAVWKSSYSSAIDAAQNTISKAVLDAITTAQKSGLQTDLDKATAAYNDLLTVTNNDGVLDWAKTTVKAELDKAAVLKISSATVTTTKTVKVVFNKAVDTTKAVLSVKNGNVVINVTPTWNTDKTEATLTSSIALAAGNYTVAVDGLGLADGQNTVNLVVAPERIDAITLDPSAYKASSTSATIGYKLTNQYGEDITKSINTATLVPTSSKGSASVTAQGTITVTGLATTDSSVVVTLVDNVFAKTASVTANIADAKAISEITLGTVAVKTGKTNLESGVNDYELSYTAKDQYGNAVKLTSADLAKITFVSSNTDVFDPAALNAVEVTTDNKLTVDFKAFNGLKNISITAIVNATGKSSSTSATVYGTATADTPTLVAPSTRFGLGDTAYQVQLTMKDQYGNDMKAADILAAYTSTPSGLTITSGNSAVFTVNSSKVVVSNDKAYVQVDAVGKGTANLTVTVNATGKTITLPLTVVDAKVASSITLTPDYTYAVNGASVVLKATFKDQYGDAITTSGDAVKFTADKNDFAAAPSDSTVTAMKSTGVTLTAAGADKTSTYTVKLYNGATVVDTKTITLTSVKADAALTYAIEDLGTIAAYSKTDAANYQGTVEVYAKDSSGNKVALVGNELQAVTSSDSKLDQTALATGNIVAAATDTDGVANFNAIVNTNTGIKTLAGTVTFSKVAPTAQKIEVKSGTGSSQTAITKATVSAGTINLTTNANVHFVVTDQYSATALTNTSYVSVFVTNKATGAVVPSTTLTSWTATTGTYNVTAVTANGLTSTVEVTVQ